MTVEASPEELSLLLLGAWVLRYRCCGVWVLLPQHPLSFPIDKTSMAPQTP